MLGRPGVETPDRVDRETGRLSAEALHGLSLLHKRRFFFFLEVDMAGSSVVWYSPRGDPLQKVERAMWCCDSCRVGEVYIYIYLRLDELIFGRFDIYVELRIYVSLPLTRSWC